MERVLGIGGYFLRAADPAALGAWYRDCLGLDTDEHGAWRQESGLTVFATFESDTDYFGSRTQQTMLNFRVRDLDAMLAQLIAKGATVAAETQDMAGVGRFGWVTDPEGNSNRTLAARLTIGVRARRADRAVPLRVPPGRVRGRRGLWVIRVWPPTRRGAA
jgi:predicted enzyme related to lactoylglutathione lyase